LCSQKDGNQMKNAKKGRPKRKRLRDDDRECNRQRITARGREAEVGKWRSIERARCK
jgi:hypothetical protein